MASKFQHGLKKNWLNIILLSAVALFVLVPNAKSWLLSMFLSLGLFKAKLPDNAGNRSSANIVPNIVFKKKDGSVVNTNALRGRIVFINFWADWCPPCRAEMPSIQALYSKLKTDDRFVFLMVNMDGSFEKADAYMNEHNYDLPVVIPVSGITEQVYNGSLPTTSIIGPGSELLMKHQGIANFNSDEFVSSLKAALP